VLTCKKNILSYKKNATLSKNRETNRVWADLLDKKKPTNVATETKKLEFAVVSCFFP
jgi:hypothetical protein